MLESNIMYNWPDVMMQCTLLDEDASHVPNILRAISFIKLAQVG